MGLNYKLFDLKSLYQCQIEDFLEGCRVIPPKNKKTL